MDNKTILNGRYEIIRPIGYGGMAEVFLAHDQLLDRDVAVKMLRDQFLEDKELLEQFRREAKSAARLVHPGIINIYDVVSEGNNQYIVMEYVDGVTLKEYLQEHKLPLNVALEIGEQLAAALNHAHIHNIIHCDIKPQNILLDKNMQPKIADFGIAKMVTNQTMVYSKAVMGSVHYISPEQAGGGQVTARSDIYSLGIVLFEMLTGQVPYNGETAVSVAMMHAERPVPQLKDYMDKVPEGLQNIIDMALAKRPESRYANAGVLRRALRSLRQKLCPDSDGEYELAPCKGSVAGADDEGATVIMQPLRREQQPLAPMPRKEPAVQKAAEPANEGKGEGFMARRKKLNYTKLMLLITAVVVAISIVAHFIFNRTLQEVAVPDVRNMTVVEAQRLLEEKEFKVSLEEQFGDPAKYKPGTVMEQSPDAGAARKEGSLVILTISRGAELKNVPEVIGMSLVKATNQLEAAGFKVGKITRKFVEGKQIGDVLGQSPKGTDKAPKGSGIDLLVNEGNIEVPNLIGKRLQEAERLLKAAGLKLGSVHKVKDTAHKPGVIVATNPDAGSKLGKGDAVSINISESGDKGSAYVDFVIPGDKRDTKVELVLIDEEGKNTLYSGSQRGGVRLRQKVEYIGSATVQLYCDGRMVSEQAL